VYFRICFVSFASRIHPSIASKCRWSLYCHNNGLSIKDVCVQRGLGELSIADKGQGINEEIEVFISKKIRLLDNYDASTRTRGSFFGDFVRTSFMDGPQFKFDCFINPCSRVFFTFNKKSSMKNNVKSST